MNRQTGPSLKANVDHYKFGEAIWRFLLSLYGGGPEVLINTEGGVRVSSPSPAAVAGKTRNLRCEETHLED